MCSFLFTTKKIENLEKVNFLLQKRGPDYTNFVKCDDFNIIHNLLSITGDFTPQPLIDGDLLLVFNGEIYNYKDLSNSSSDGYCILNLYKEFGVDGLSKLDGEFAIIILDKQKKQIIISTDTFGTKPLYYAINEKNVGISSYPTPLEILSFSNINRVDPNTIICLSSDSFEIIEKKILYEFNLSQTIQTYDLWVQSFIDSVKKRSNTQLEILVPLSSGYDSGAICSVLNEISREYISFSIQGRENRNILNERFNRNKNSKKEIVTNLNSEIINEIKQEMNLNSEKFWYGPNFKQLTHFGFDDSGSIGLYYILKKMKEKYNIKILLSGQGSDEIMSNIQTYGFKTVNPKYFVNDLNSIFPWGNFFYGSQWSYLMKEECIAGSLGIETRYPYLDRSVVQNFLYLDPKLKNIKYKAPLYYYFTEKKYPFAEEKIGFQIN